MGKVQWKMDFSCLRNAALGHEFIYIQKHVMLRKIKIKITR